MNKEIYELYIHNNNKHDDTVTIAKMVALKTIYNQPTYGLQFFLIEPTKETINEGIA